MASLTVSPVVQPVTRTSIAMFAVFMKEIKYEFLKLFRTKTFTLSILGFPLMFYVLFGISDRGHMIDTMDAAKYMLAGYCCFGLVGAALFGIGVGLASERSQGWLELKRSSPMPPMAYLLAKCVTAQAFGLMVVGILTLIGVGFGGVHVTGQEFAKMLGVAVVGTVPFAAMGLLIALLVPANAASGIVNLIYLPMSFMSGLWIPLKYLPDFLRPIAPGIPTYHLSQLMLSVFGYQKEPWSAMTHWSGLAGFTLLMLGVSWAVFHRAEQDA